MPTEAKKKLISVRMSLVALDTLERLQEVWGTGQAETISRALERAWWDEQRQVQSGVREVRKVEGKGE